MPKTRPRRADREQFWRDAIADWKTSGQTIRAFCASRGIGQATFYAKRRALADRGTTRRPDVAHDPAPSFAVVRVVPDPVIEVVLPSGVTLRVAVGIDPTAVARLAAALGTPPC